MTDETAISTALRQRRLVSDLDFDRLYPLSHRTRSPFHWTPIDVALRACALLAPQPGERVLDVGSGVGKLCLVGALSWTATWVGIERDLAMILAADAAARKLSIAGGVEFIHGDAMALDWTTFDAIYMFNPFAETLFQSTIEPGSRRDEYIAYVERARVQLARLRPRARLVTYHGYGGEIPDDFDLVALEQAREDRLCLWIRR